VRSSEQVLLQASKYCDGGALDVCHVQVKDSRVASKLRTAEVRKRRRE
jgi:hypothetical protein